MIIGKWLKFYRRSWEGTLCMRIQSRHLQKNYWISVRGLEKEYCKAMGMLYMMTRFKGAEKVTTDFEAVMHKKPKSFRQFVRDNAAAWQL